MRRDDPESLAMKFALPPIADLHPAEARMIVAVRRSIAARSIDRDMAPPIAALFPQDGAANRMLILLEVIGSAWPEPFTVGSPCCRSINPDEWILVQMLRRVAIADRPAFDALLCEMIPDDARERTYAAMEEFLVLFRCAGKA